MTLRKTIITSAAFLALAACGRSNDAVQNNTTAAQAGVANEATTAPVAMSAAQNFANAAAASDTFEIETSRLALTNGASALVKSYANKMIEAHTTSTSKLMAAAAAVTPTVTPNPTLNAEQQLKLDQLKALNGAAFDQAYKTEQTAGHQQTLDALKTYASAGEATPLKAFASSMVPIVTAHLNMVKGLKV
ncbi:DUF4142 domain-containing protein [Sphingomonas sp. CFBP 13720]|uniref:DUF4142 domain-containing protein n=1 Tax=Sphingomonas sp. CFBP 13720 TaxID=2775302 RepID=UPI00178004CA|nr:DUF4142 domain-containing protein [Sphingomonas sp. CFBP 13720]MBD8680081.1 DUF4142 domain-containing protein [Sphingomonas sp. CFBP 13720]